MDNQITTYVYEDDEIKSLMALAEMPKDQIKREMDINYLKMVVKNNQKLDRMYIVDFIHKCQLTGADPRLNQIYLISYDAWNPNTQQKEPKGTTVFSYQYFIRLAQQTGCLEDFDVETKEDTYVDFNGGAKRKPSLTSYAWVIRKGQGTLKYKARLWEFAKTDRNGNLMGNWKASTYLMLEKCAIANVMRWAFPEVLGNMYIKDEMERATGTDHIEIEKKQEKLNGAIAYNNTTAPRHSEKPKPEGLDSIIVTAPIEKIEEKKVKLSDIIIAMDDLFFEKIGKCREDIMLKINEETEIENLSKMEIFIESYVRSKANEKNRNQENYEQDSYSGTTGN